MIVASRKLARLSPRQGDGLENRGWAFPAARERLYRVRSSMREKGFMRNWAIRLVPNSLALMSAGRIGQERVDSFRQFRVHRVAVPCQLAPRVYHEGPRHGLDTRAAEVVARGFAVRVDGHRVCHLVAARLYIRLDRSPVFFADADEYDAIVSVLSLEFG